MHLDEDLIDLKILSFGKSYLNTNKGSFNSTVLLSNAFIGNFDIKDITNIKLENIKALLDNYNTNIVIIGSNSCINVNDLYQECMYAGISLHWQSIRSALNSSLLLISEQRRFISLLFLQ